MSKTKAIALMREIPAVVVSAGHTQKTVKVRVGLKQLNNPIKNISLLKYSGRQQTQLVHDPNNSLRIGDIIAITGGSWVSKDVQYTVDRIIVPFGPPLEERPPVPTIMERLAVRAEKRRLKKERQSPTGHTYHDNQRR
ncbi:Bgt-484 [Blumeria graminis f. sp. tritici]|uniref:Bgt-484 n=3 Tax=Blumeria graminis TaxID=34373 RepID=A0A9X9L6Z5_BLUGR|nr:Bgt-484 [Blumeria graminis f. sp. tritici]